MTAARKIAVLTGSRAEYGLLTPLVAAIHEDAAVELQLIVTGTHLSTEFGSTVKDIEFPIAERVEMLLSGDSPLAISKSMGLALIGIAEALDRLKPDILVLLGDRFEILPAAAAAMNMLVPIAHIHGGETTEGAIDEAIRHAVSKMAHLHFTSTEPYRQRLLQLGENPAHVYNFGAPVLDTIRRFEPMGRAELEESLNVGLSKSTFLVTFHPATLDSDVYGEQFRALLSALDAFPDRTIVFTKPNADAHGRIIIELIDEYEAAHRGRVCSFLSLGHRRYLSLLSYVDLVVGNSSSGIFEAPQFGVPTINIGDRQKGRLKPASVVSCLPSTDDIVDAIETALDDTFRAACREVDNPYGDGTFAENALAVLKSAALDRELLKKRFFDLESYGQ